MVASLFGSLVSDRDSTDSQDVARSRASHTYVLAGILLEMSMPCRFVRCGCTQCDLGGSRDHSSKGLLQQTAAQAIEAEVWPPHEVHQRSFP